MVSALRRELVGPAPKGQPADFSTRIVFESSEASYGPWLQAHSGEEVLQRDPPTRRYGVGVLYPIRSSTPLNSDDPGEASSEDPDAGASEDEIAEVAGAVTKIADRKGGRGGDHDDLDLSNANDYRPSSMAVSFYLDVSSPGTLRVEVSGGRYRPTTVEVKRSDPQGGKEAAVTERTWWLREPVLASAEFEWEALRVEKRRVVRPAVASGLRRGPLTLGVSSFVRPPRGDHALVTVALTNTTTIRPPIRPDEGCLFQTRFVVTATTTDGRGAILPYPRRSTGDKETELELRSYDLLYRRAQTFGIGHGCSADWSAGWGTETASWVSAESLPTFETPSITPDLEHEGEPLRVSMAALAGLDPANDGIAQIKKVLDTYESWISEQEREAVPRDLQDVASDHLSRCRKMLSRMREGLAFVLRDARASKAFRLANHAVLLQQLRTRTTARKVTFDADGRFAFEEAFEPMDWRAQSNRGYWRAFQIAFLLATIKSISDGADVDRATVDLIFFPTGGGKTEAYLGQTAFAAFMRRLVDPTDTGVEVLMRYTLRLLTAQQFLRASSLICAMEHLRQEDEALGDTPFSIGIWLGGDTTPNSRQEAKATLTALNKGERSARNLFLLLRCPWCSAQMGPIEARKARGQARHGSTAPRVAGYHQSGATVVFRCPDQTCSFRTGLPIFVIDEDIYEHKPTLVIGTVDKFAQLSWRPEPRALFGLGEDGARVTSPPGLIIQDELHLISGPLGSMVGLFEAVIEDLATDRRAEPPVRPKLIASTATIRRFEAQVRALYARDRVALFPPHGINASDSFFGKYALRPDGTRLPGRLYVGIHAPGLGSVQTAQVRTFAALLQAAGEMPRSEADPWYTLLAFFNSLRELGTSLTLLQSDIPDYLRVLRNRYGIPEDSVRRLQRVIELTSRLRDDEVPQAIEDLQTPATLSGAVDVCLSSSIIEVGVDIDRLSLITLLGQPKSTSQYIQVTGRIGRQWRERPGLAVVVYSASKPRDRSHFERFRSYHDRLYAQIEPTSVTPFAPPVLERSLHAAIVAFVRQRGDATLKPWPQPLRLIDIAADILVKRVKVVDPLETSNVERIIERRIEEWQDWERTEWSASTWTDDEQTPLLRRAGEWAPRRAERVSWPTQTSMRNVDAECRAEVTPLYAIGVDDS